MTDADDGTDYDAVRSEQGGRLRVPRSRGVVSGVLLALAGIWAAFVPFVGPAFDFAYRPKPDETWHWTAARGWYEVLPGGLAIFGGLLLILSASRVVTSLGAWLAALAGAWLVVDQQVSYLLTLGSPGVPAAPGDRRYVAEYLAFFTGIGAFIVFIAAIAIGRLSVRSVRDARAHERSALAEREAAEREDYERDTYDRAAADREVTDRNAEAWSARPDGGYGTPGATEALPPSGPPVEHSPTASAVTTELPVAGDHPRDDHPYDEHAAGPDDDTTAMPVVHDELVRDEPVQEASERDLPVQDEPVQEASVQEASERDVPVPEEPVPEEPVPEEPVQEASERDVPVPEEPVPEEPVQEASERDVPEQQEHHGHEPLVLEPPTDDDNHARPDQPQRDVEDVPSGNSATVWNPDAQSPTTTGELPVLGSTSAPANPPPVDKSPRRGIQAPRRYFGANNAAPQDEPAGAPAAQRDPVRTDEADDFDDLDLDEPRR